MLLRQTPVPFVIDDNGDLLMPVLCDSCRTIVYMTDDDIRKTRAHEHTIWCSDCHASRIAQTDYDNDAHDEAH